MKSNNKEKIIDLVEKLKKHEINWHEYQDDLNKIIDEDKDQKDQSEKYVLTIKADDQSTNSYSNYNKKNLLLHEEEEEQSENKENESEVLKENEVPVNNDLNNTEIKSENNSNHINKNKYIKEEINYNNDFFNTEVNYVNPKNQLFIKNKKPIIKVRYLTKKKSSKKLLDNISFDIFPGEFHIFLGNNGSGKTTVIKSIVGAYSKYKYKGTITIKDRDNENADVKKYISYIPENAIFPKKITLNDYLILFANLSNIPEKEIEYKVDEIIKELGLEDFKNKKPYNFSSGQKKKVLLAQGMINDPEIIILDEPAANLDPVTRQEIFMYLINQKNKGKTIFIASHIFDEISDYVTYCTILDKNKVVFDNFHDSSKISLKELYEKYISNKTY